MAGIDGTYAVTVSALGKSVSGTMVMEQHGSSVIGSVSIIGQTVPIEKGRIEGNEITGKTVAKFPKVKGRIKIRVRASVDGDTISGALKAVVGKAKFVGTRMR